jgi:hypothetical protein
MNGAGHGAEGRLEVNGLMLRPPGYGSVVGIPSVAACVAYVIVGAYGSHGSALLAAVVAGLVTLVLMWILRVAMLSRIRQEMYADTVVVRERR